LTQEKKPQVILLDDAFQHRKVKAGFYILLTAYDDVFVDDFLLPTGNLRESRSGAQRANVIVVTKCPTTLSETEQSQIKQRIKSYSDTPVYFSTIAFDESVQSSTTSVPVATIQQSACVLLAGIAKPASFFNYLKNANAVCLTYPDHHHFTETDIQQIKQQAGEKMIVTTEKDYVRLKDSILKGQLYYLPIRTSLLVGSNEFDAKVLDYLKQ
jgi:tetraacyldisaccharide 4'-kinase